MLSIARLSKGELQGCKAREGTASFKTARKIVLNVEKSQRFYYGISPRPATNTSKHPLLMARLESTRGYH